MAAASDNDYETVLFSGEVNMQFIVKLSISIGIIVLVTQVGRRFPTLGGLLATMPLTGAIILIWLYSDNRGDFELLGRYTKGALWGIVPSILFFVVAYFAFKKQLPFGMILAASFGAWVIGAVVHQLLLR
jgi:uncharacterized membrane protein (GlpM family)